jgi:hypothetical protein
MPVEGAAGTPPRRRTLAALLVGLAALGLGAAVARRHFIRGFFSDGRPGAPPSLAQSPSVGVTSVGRVRILLIDGLDAAAARELPALDGLCRAGLDLRVDVGFPTVSLPVQSVLWTGRTQQQSGLLYRIAPLPTPPPDAVPLRVPGSVAVSEDQAFIARSFGFTAWEGPAAGFPAAALEAAAASGPLALIHVLRVDKAGHRGGTGSEAYRSAALWADQLLVQLLQAAPAGEQTRWFVLSDHGHRRAGGHGGAEPGVRIVRACIAGGSALPGTGASSSRPVIHLVDLARAVTDSLQLPPAAGSAGRPLGFALAHPDPGATLPRAGPIRVALAGLLLVAGLVLGPGRRRPRPILRLLPLWMPLAYLSVVLLRGLPTLSNPIVYPPLGREAILAATPGLAFLALALGLVLGRRPEQLPAFCRAQLAGPVGLTAACLLACGAGSDRPPLLPFWTAHASVFLSLLAAASLLLALGAGLAVLLATGRSRRTRPPAPRSAPGSA